MERELKEAASPREFVVQILRRHGPLGLAEIADHYGIERRREVDLGYLRDLGGSSLTDPTLPIFMYSQLRFPARLPPTVALGSIIIFVSFAVLCFSLWLRRYGVEETTSDGVRP